MPWPPEHLDDSLVLIRGGIASAGLDVSVLPNGRADEPGQSSLGKSKALAVALEHVREDAQESPDIRRVSFLRELPSRKPKATKDVAGPGEGGQVDSRRWPITGAGTERP